MMYNGKNVHGAWGYNTWDFKGFFQNLPAVRSWACHSLVCSFRHSIKMGCANTVALSHLSKWYIYTKKWEILHHFYALILSCFVYKNGIMCFIQSVIHPFRKYLLSSYCVASCSREWWEVFTLYWALNNIVHLSSLDLGLVKSSSCY